jgi:small subunit ribosomal protein S11
MVTFHQQAAYEYFLVIIHLQCTQNNTLGSLVNPRGKLLYTASCGHLHFKGSLKSASIAGQQVVSTLSKKAFALGLGKVPFLVRIKGIGKGRYSAIKELKKSGLNVLKVIDKTSVPYNGCRVKK